MLHNLVWKLGRIDNPPEYPITFTQVDGMVYSEFEVPENDPNREYLSCQPLYFDLAPGVVECDLNFEHSLCFAFCSCRLIDEYAVSKRSNYERSDYGVADNVEQVLAYYSNEISDPDHTYLITMVAMLREHQPEQGGWRWHKWGEYIGTQNTRSISVSSYRYSCYGFCFHILEVEAEKGYDSILEEIMNDDSRDPDFADVYGEDE